MTASFFWGPFPGSAVDGRSLVPAYAPQGQVAAAGSRMAAGATGGAGAAASLNPPPPPAKLARVGAFVTALSG